MGNCVVAWRLRGGKEEEGEDEGSVKVVRCSDGEEFLFPGPVMVEDLMYGFQGMAIYASKDDGDDNTPVSPEVELRPGDHVYYLKKPSSSSSSSTPPSSDSEDDDPADDLVINGSHDAAAAAAAGDGAISSVLRVRLVMSSLELSQLLQGRRHLISSPSSSSSSSPSDLIAQKLQHLLPTSHTPPPPVSSPWKPSLSHIPESD